MLPWDEEVKPTASLSPSSSRSDPLFDARFSGPPVATLPEAAGNLTAASTVSRTAGPTTGRKHHVIAADTHVTNGHFGFFVTPNSQTTCNKINSVRDKDGLFIPFIEALMNPQLKVGTPQVRQRLLKSLTVFACVMNGLFFHIGLSQILVFRGKNKMIDLKEDRNFFKNRVIEYPSGGVLSSECPDIMTHLFSQTLASDALWTHIQGAGTPPNNLNRLTHTHLREVIYAN